MFSNSVEDIANKTKFLFYFSRNITYNYKTQKVDDRSFNFFLTRRNVKYTWRLKPAVAF